jgi:preprotein translocase subunit SecF
MSRLAGFGNQLYTGEKSFDIVGKRRRWYITSAVILLTCIGSLVVQGLNLGIEFTGGTVVQLSAPEGSVEEAREALADAGIEGAVVTETSEGRLRIQTESLEQAQRDEAVQALADTFDQPIEEVDVQFVGPSWGQEITKKAIYGLLIFLVFVVLFLSIYFEWKMALAALIALVHDVLITIGVYSLTGIEVTPATVVGVLTILGYSLYDTVVVFDKVKENTKGIAGGSRSTYSEAANLAVNQTLVRSINTTLVALLPVAAILIGAVGALGASTLTELGLALFVGMLAGAFSSIFIATPALCDMKELEPEMKALRTRVAQRRAGGGKPSRVARSSATKAKGGASSSGSATATDVLDEVADESGDSDAPASSARTAGPRNQPTRKKKRR